MKRLLLIAVASLCVPFSTVAQENSAKDSAKGLAPKQPAGGESEANDSEAPKSAADALRATPNDPLAWRKYVVEQFSQLFPLVQSKPEEAEKRIKEINKFIDELKPTDEVGKNQQTAVRGALKGYQDQIAATRMTLEEVGEKLKAAPDDLKLIQALMMKLSQVSMTMRDDPDAAEKSFAEAKKIAATAREAATSETAKNQYERIDQFFSNIERSLEAAKKLTALIGKDAAPIKIDTWVNGDPISDEDLKGKVVLLDFWAIWCGPCIATFPHLIEWNEKYEKKGLVMIGLTRFYGWEWDEAAGRPKKAQGEVPPEKEVEMLKQFAAHHKLTHRFGVQAEDKLSEYYGVTGIPHVVLIDRKGKIRMMKVGSGEANAKAISEMLEKLLNDEVAAN